MNSSHPDPAADTGPLSARRPSLPSTPLSPSNPSTTTRLSRPAFTTSLSDFALPSPRPSSPSLLSQQARIAPPILTSGYGYALRPRSSLARSVVNAGQEDDSDAERQSTRKTGSPFASRHRDTLRRAGLSGRDRDEDGEAAGDDYRGFTTRARSSEHSSDRNSGSHPSMSPRSVQPQHRPRRSRDREHSPLTRRPVSPDSLESPSREGKAEGAEDIDIDFDLDGMDMRMTEGDETRPTAEFATVASEPITALPERDGSKSLSQEAWPSPPHPRRRSSADNAVPTLTTIARRSSVAPPLLRVMSLLRDESRPSESEVASEAKLTRRLGQEADALEYRREREGIPFPPHGRDGASEHSASLILPGISSSGTGFPSSDYSLHMDDEDSMSDSKALSASQEEDGLLDNVGFESDHTTSESSDILSPPAEASAIAPFLEESNADHSGSQSAMSGRGSAAHVKDEELRERTQMDEDDDDNSQTADAGIFAATPPPSAFRIGLPQTDGLMQRSHSRSSSYPTPDSGVSQHPSKLSTPTGDSTPPGIASSSVHKRVGSAWSQFRNSPSPASGTMSTTLEKRHHHRVHNGSYHRAGANKTDREGNGAKASTSPAGGSGNGSVSNLTGSAIDHNISSSPGTLASSARTKRKFGPEERFEPYASSVYKRRAVSPLTGMNLPLTGLGSLPSGATASLSSSPVVPSSFTNAAAAVGSSHSTGCPTPACGVQSASPHGSGGLSYYRSAMAGRQTPPAGGRERDGGYFGRRSIGVATAPTSRGVASATAAGVMGGNGMTAVPRSPTTRPSTPLGGFDSNNSLNATMAAYYSSSPPVSSLHYRPGPPMPIGLGLGTAAAALLGSSPKSSGSGPGYGSGGLGLSIAANSRDDFDSPFGSGGAGSLELGVGGNFVGSSGRRSRMSSPVASRKRGFPGSGESTPGAAERSARGYVERDGGKSREREKSKQGGEEMEGGVERMML